MSEKENLQNADGTEENLIQNSTPEAVNNSVSENANAITEGAIEEIEASNAEDAEDENNSKRHEIEEKDYHTMSMDELVDELSTLVSNENIQIVRAQVETVKNEFSAKFSALLEEKKEEFLASGGNSIDFRFNNPLKARFNVLYKDYKDRKQAYYKTLEKSLKDNFDSRLEIIEEIKNLLNVEENINTTYKHFKALQERWKNTGPIPRDKYNNVWNNYHHHVENFYDFLHLNRDLRDLDFKHNLEKKQKIVARAQELAKDDNTNRAFRELQVLHKLWKEELGPVAKEFRDEIWEKFSTATKAIHEKRQEYFADLDKSYEKNLEKKNEIIAQIDTIAQDATNNHGAWQKKIKTIEALRQDFFNAGKVPIKVNEATWAKFKDSVRNFNRNKNAFYKGLKKEQYDNLQKKLELISIAEQNKDNDDFEATTPLMKKIQSDWKKIGHVPRKDSDKIWKQFKGACNAYFDKLHAVKNEENKEELAALEEKTAFLEKVKTIQLTKDKQESLTLIKEQINAWKAIGTVPYNKRFIDKKFNKAIDALFNQLDMNKNEAELLKYDNKLDTLASADDNRLLDNERNFIRKKIDEIKSEINQLENNLQFFSNVDDNNPLVRDVHKNINRHKSQLLTWQDKLKKIKQFYS
ncbi:MAG: DUF349 domain-containing protein [Flavobacteriaceae bacterium]|nr:DUF349 domain-containing protein [Flavobacteriaceae bacterium]